MSSASRMLAISVLSLAVFGANEGCRKADSTQNGNGLKGSAEPVNPKVVLDDKLSPDEQKQYFGWLFGDAETMERMRNVEKVIAYRVASKPLDYLTDETRARATSGDKIGSFPVLDEPVEMTREDAQSLLDYLLDGSNLSSLHSMCKMEPGVAARFESKGESVDVLICFKCDQVAASHGRYHGSGDYRGLTALLPLFRKLFPNDEVLQALK